MNAYFFCVPPTAMNETRYQHLAIALAEGFEMLGIPFSANISTWFRSPGRRPLFQNDPAIDPRECAVIFFTEDWFLSGNSLPEFVNDKGLRPLLVYLDSEDGGDVVSLRPEFRRFDVVLRASYQKNARYPGNFEPWAFGLTQRIIDATADGPTFAARRRRILVSYRHTKFPHTVRLYVDRAILKRLASTAPTERYFESAETLSDPLVELLKIQTGGRHSPPYYRQLKDSMASAAFGGFFISRFTSNPASLATKLSRRFFLHTGLPAGQILQWDSWRFWESLAAGCVTLHLDLEKYGCLLPEMPVNWRHYAGIDLHDVRSSAAKFAAALEPTSRLGESGRAWAIEHYGPRAVACRFLRWLDRHRPYRPA